MHLGSVKLNKAMRILILGADGFIGNVLYRHLDGEVLGVDNGARKRMVKEIGGESLTEIHKNETIKLDITDYKAIKEIIDSFKPDAIVHLAEQPSAPYSMIDAEHTAYTQWNNLVGTTNILWAIKGTDIHLIKLGTAGEYPDWLYTGIKVPESERITVKYQGKDWEIPTPRYAGSFYHFSKMFDSYNIDYACKIWGLNVTDLNQGVIFGHMDGTRLDYDSFFGTVFNRFAVQASAGIPLTVYGEGGQERGYIHIKNALEAIELAVKNPAKGYRIIHQLTQTHKVMDIAKMFQEATGCEIKSIPNPRAELPANEIEFEAKKLREMGLTTIPMQKEVPNILKAVEGKKVNKDVILPTTQWQK